MLIINFYHEKVSLFFDNVQREQFSTSLKENVMTRNLQHVYQALSKILTADHFMSQVPHLNVRYIWKMKLHFFHTHQSVTVTICVIKVSPIYAVVHQDSFMILSEKNATARRKPSVSAICDNDYFLDLIDIQWKN